MCIYVRMWETALLLTVDQDVRSDCNKSKHTLSCSCISFLNSWGRQAVPSSLDGVTCVLQEVLRLNKPDFEKYLFESCTCRVWATGMVCIWWLIIFALNGRLATFNHSRRKRFQGWTCSGPWVAGENIFLPRSPGQGRKAMAGLRCESIWNISNGESQWSLLKGAVWKTGSLT